MPSENTAVNDIFSTPYTNIPVFRSSATQTPHTGDPVLTFLSVDDTLGRIPEAWFVRNGYLFQLTMYAPPDDDGDPLRVVWLRDFLQDITFTPQ